ncbi:MAG: type IV secretion system protein VirB10 [Beijerinckiaceae bacterium]
MALTEEQYRALAAEADGLIASRPAASPEAKRNTWLIMALIAAAAAAIVYLLSPPNDGPSRRLTDPDREQFSSARIDVPVMPGPAQPRTSDRIELMPAPQATLPPVQPPPPEPPVLLPVPAQLPPAPTQAPPPTGPVDDSARRAAEEAERRRWERLRSPMMVFDDGASGSATAASGDRAVVAAPDEDPNRRFLASIGSQDVETSVARRIERIDALIPQGTMIRGVLETAINSDLAGMVRAQTLEDVWSFDGRRVLVPKGTRLIGEYRAGVARGQTRIFIVWSRMLRADGVSVQLGSIGTDALGRSGMPGEVDNKYLERFGSAILLSLVGGASQFIAGLGQTNSNTNSGNLQIVDPITGQVTTIQRDLSNQERIANARQIASAQTANTLTQLAQEALKDSIGIQPTIHVDQGEPIIVFVRRDLDFSRLYPDPVREALQELKSGRTDRQGRPVRK